MGQVTIYLDDKTEAKMIRAAKSANVSKSKWIASLIQTKVVNEWPASIAELAGAWKDFPDIEEIRNSNSAKDIGREPL